MPKKAKASRLAFDAVQANSLDTITVPRGYSWHTVVSWEIPSGLEQTNLTILREVQVRARS